ncbi:hypothetical protein D3C87_1229580 [compost metagenome]
MRGNMGFERAADGSPLRRHDQHEEEEDGECAKLRQDGPGELQGRACQRIGRKGSPRRESILRDPEFLSPVYGRGQVLAENRLVLRNSFGEDGKLPDDNRQDHRRNAKGPEKDQGDRQTVPQAPLLEALDERSHRDGQREGEEDGSDDRAHRLQQDEEQKRPRAKDDHDSERGGVEACSQRPALRISRSPISGISPHSRSHGEYRSVGLGPGGRIAEFLRASRSGKVELSLFKHEGPALRARPLQGNRCWSR